MFENTLGNSRCTRKVSPWISIIIKRRLARIIMFGYKSSFVRYYVCVYCVYVYRRCVVRVATRFLFILGRKKIHAYAPLRGSVSTTMICRGLLLKYINFYHCINCLTGRARACKR